MQGELNLDRRRWGGVEFYFQEDEEEDQEKDQEEGEEQGATMDNSQINEEKKDTKDSNLGDLISNIESDTLLTNQKAPELPEIMRTGVNELGYKVIYDEEKDPNVVTSQAARDFFMLGETKDTNGNNTTSEKEMSQQIKILAPNKKRKEDVRSYRVKILNFNKDCLQNIFF